ncbi:MAG: GHKL domain-containing protein [Clostridia bacterium]|nr:GHKL domain-containing protein [Clostridia bacterium]
MIGICLFRAIVYAIIKIKKLSITIGDYIRSSTRYSIILTTIVTISVYFMIEVVLNLTNFIYPIFFINILLLIFIAYISIKLIVRGAMLEEKDGKIHNLETYNKTLSIMYDSLRGFRHDYANFIQALNGYIQMDDLDGIKDLSKSITKDCISIRNMGTLDFKIINNPAVYSIIINKFYSAQDKNIQMNVEVMIDINSIKMSVYELCRILGILIDNAIEAAEKCEDKVINIRFIKDAKVDRKLIIIENSYYNKEVDVEKIFEKGVSSKESIGNEHGLGLWIIRKILRKNRNVNLYTTKGELFCQQLEVYEF